MKTARTAAAAISVTGAALGLGLVPGLSASAGAATSTTAAPAAVAGKTPVVINACPSAPAIRPREFGLSCDSSDFLVRLRWARWAVNDASGHGAESINDCVPDCAHGKFHYYPARVSFWGTAAVKGHPGEVRYTHYTLTYTKTPPPGFGHTRTGSFY